MLQCEDCSKLNEAIVGKKFTCGSFAEMDTGEATWNTPSHPSTAGSKAPSSSKFAWNKWSLSLEQKNNRPVDLAEAKKQKKR